MRIFLINLARRPDRMEAMTAQMGRLGLAFEDVKAVDAAHTPDEEVNRRFASSGPLGEIPKGDKCCALSHRLAWEAFLRTGEDYGVILEDDVILTPGAAALFKDTKWIPPGTALLKLEQYGPASQRILVSDVTPVASGFEIGRLCSRHTGAAAYVINHTAATRLLEMEKWCLPVDHMLFNPNNSPVFAVLRPQQLIPSVARQAPVGARSDIETWRIPLRRLDWTYAKREIVRFGYELKLLPRQLLSLLSGKAKLVRIGTETLG